MFLGLDLGSQCGRLGKGHVFSIVSRTRTAHSRPISTVHRGNAFEERSLRLLRDHFSMSLKRVGGRDDGGIDLLGWWWLPPHDCASHKPSSKLGPAQRRRIRVIGQCKAEKKKMGPNYVRELEGVLYRLVASPHPALSHPADNSRHLDMDANSDADCASETLDNSGRGQLVPGNPSPIVALLVSQSPFTKATILRAQSSPLPFLLLHLPPIEPPLLDGDVAQGDAGPGGSIGAALWNPALGGANGPLSGKMEVRWERDLIGGQGRPGLWWLGKKLHSWIPDDAVVGT